MDVTFVTGNSKKAEEAEKILGFPLKIQSAELPEIQELDPEMLARHKMSEAAKIINPPFIVDDAVLYISPWNGFPGPFIKWILQSGEAELLLKMMKDEVDRRATARLVIGFHDGKSMHTFIGEVEGEIATEKRGVEKKGWWDQVFIPKGHTKTYAEMSIEEKNEISHRKKALEKFKNFLKENKFIV